MPLGVIIFMKKRIISILALGMALAMTVGCGQVKVADCEVDTIVIGGDDTVRGINVSDFTKSYYDETELNDFIENTIDEYVAKNGEDTVKCEEVIVEDGVAKAGIKYASAKDYASFNNVDFYIGTVLDARAAGYELPSDCAKTEYAKDDLQETSDKVAVIGQATDVQVGGTIIYATPNVVVLDAKHATVNYDMLDTEAELAYIVYK